MDYSKFKKTVDALLTQKKLNDNKNVAVKRFVADFEAHAFTRHAEFGDGVEMLALLASDKSLFAGTKFDKNFTMNLMGFVSGDLAENKTFQSVVKVLTGNKSKGVGIGELILPLLVSGWTRVNDSDGFVSGGTREIKNGEGASLKPVKTGLTNKGLVDELNKKYFGGLVLGKKDHAKLIAKYGDFSKPIYSKYFSELWPGAEVEVLIKSLTKIGSDVDKFHNAVGRFILREYKKIDGWKSIVLIDPNTLEVVNIADINDDTGFDRLHFTVRLSRLKDTQAVPDGYAVVKLKKAKKA